MHIHIHIHTHGNTRTYTYTYTCSCLSFAASTMMVTLTSSLYANLNTVPSRAYTYMYVRTYVNIHAHIRHAYTWMRTGTLEGQFLFKNSGSGSFTRVDSVHPGRQYRGAACGGRLVMADFNNDNNLDVMIPLQHYTDQSDNKVLLVLGDGKGNFREAWEGVTSGVFLVEVAAADVNQDGNVDVVAPLAYAYLLCSYVSMYMPTCTQVIWTWYQLHLTATCWSFTLGTAQATSRQCPFGQGMMRPSSTCRSQILMAMACAGC